MENNNDLIEVVNDLVLINNDRIVGYEKAVEEVDNSDEDLKAVFRQMANQSRTYKQQLSAEVTRLGGEVADGTTNAGKLYRTWMDIKATFSGDDRQTALNNCEFGEDAAQKAYKEALADEDLTSGDIRQLLTDQKAELRTAHDKIKAMRDANKAMS